MAARRPPKPRSAAVKAAADRAAARSEGKPEVDTTPASPIDPPIKTAAEITEDIIEKKRGAPELPLTDEVAADICSWIASGKSLRAYCIRPETPGLTTVFKWLSKYPAFANQYTLAREAQADAYADEIADIADNEADPNKARVRIDARKWAAGKMRPKKYGERQVLEHQGKDGGPIDLVAGRSEIEQARRVAFALGRVHERLASAKPDDITTIEQEG